MALGDFHEESIPFASAVLMPNSSPAKTILSISLPAEDLDVQADITLIPDSGVSIIERHVTLEVIPNVIATTSPNFGATNADHKTNAPSQAEVVPSGTKRFNFRGSGGGTVYVNMVVTWTGAGNVRAYGYVRARSFG